MLHKTQFVRNAGKDFVFKDVSVRFTCLLELCSINLTMDCSVIFGKAT